MGRRTISGAGQVFEQQVPDELLRFARRAGTSLEQAVRGRTVMVTGASSGSAARRR